jgi:hypothetical protein
MKPKFTTEITAEAIMLCDLLIVHNIAFSSSFNATDKTYIIELNDSAKLSSFRRICGTVTTFNLII